MSEAAAEHRAERHVAHEMKSNRLFQLGAQPLNRVARWDGAAWNGLGNGTAAVTTKFAGEPDAGTGSVVSMKSGSVTQMNRPPAGRVHSAWRGKWSASASRT